MITANKIAKKHLETSIDGPVDLEQRISALDVTKSTLVVAGAGSGKTGLLIQRYLSTLSIVKKPEEIIAITFTNKAAFEMRTRTIEALHDAKSLEEVPEDPHDKLTWELAKNALSNLEANDIDIFANPNRLKIKTNDSFYADIARRAPLSALLGGGLNVSDDPQRCYSLAAKSLLSDLEKGEEWGKSLESILMHVDNRFDKAETLMISLLEKRERWLPIVLSAKNSLELRENLESTLKFINTELHSQISTHIEPYSNQIIELASFASKNIDFKKTPGLIGLKEVAETTSLFELSHEALLALTSFILTTQGKVRKSATAAIGFPAPSSVKDSELKSLYKRHKENAADLFEHIAGNKQASEALVSAKSLPPCFYTDENWEILGHLLILLPVLAAKLLLVFQQLGEVDYTEISTSALRVLGDPDNPTDLALFLDSQINHVLIDEFQDTSELQLETLKMIIAGWQQGDGRTMFLVGDPMQSLYYFRGSNVGLFLDVIKNGVGNVNLSPLNLSVNFRSQAGIVDWVNNTFSKVFPSESDKNLGSVEYMPSTPAKKVCKSSGIQVVGFDEADSNHKEQEAEWISEQIKDIRSSSKDSVSVLVKNRSHLKSILKSFRSKDIPYQALDIDYLATCEVIKDLSSLTRAFCHFGDRTSWLALLRSPLCGLGMEALEKVACSSRSLIWKNLHKAKILNLLDEEDQNKIARLVGILRQSLKHRERKSLASIIEGAWLSLNGPSTIEHSKELDNATSFFGAIKEMSYTSFDLSLFTDKIERLFAKADNYGENPVQIMTLHKSKGLQFDHVFIPGCNNGSRANSRQLLLWDRYTSHTGKELPLISTSDLIGENKNKLSEFIRTQENKRSAFELQRVIYVGCTRAKKSLYLSSSLSFLEDGSATTPPLNTFIGILWPAVKDQVVRTQVSVEDKKELSEERSKGFAPVNKHLDVNIKAPTLPIESLLAKYRGLIEPNNSELPSLDWEINFSSQFGKLVHRILRRVCLDGLDVWNDGIPPLTKEAWKHQLSQMGVPPFITPSFVNRAETLVTKVLKDPTARWILDNNHAESSCELPIASVEANEFSTIIIDRTFVSDNKRWIVDYKTGSLLKEENQEQYIERMKNEHSDQLLKYSNIMQSFGPEKVSCGLYLAAIQKFIEIDKPACTPF